MTLLHQEENINRDRNYLKRAKWEVLALKNTIAKMNNSSEGPHGTLGLDEERIRAHGDIDRGYAIWNTEKKEWTRTRKNDPKRRENLISV